MKIECSEFTLPLGGYWSNLWLAITNRQKRKVRVAVSFSTDGPDIRLHGVWTSDKIYKGWE